MHCLYAKRAPSPISALLRSKSPVIFRAMDQWFVALDKENLRQRCLDGLKDVSFTPEWGRNQFMDSSKHALIGAFPGSDQYGGSNSCIL